MVVLGLLVLVCVMGAALAVTIPAARRADTAHDGVMSDPFNPPDAPAVQVECECGRVLSAGTRDHHIVAALFTDDAHLAGGAVEGGTAMVADYCPKHCPGGCNHGCWTKLRSVS
jgi:hypothetical protein